MVGFRLAHLGLVLVLAAQTGVSQDDDVTRVLRSYYKGEDAVAVKAARAWIDHQGGALGWYYLGRIHMRHGRYENAREAFRSGLRFLNEQTGSPSRALRSRLKRMDRLAGSMVKKQAQLAEQFLEVRNTALTAGRDLCEAGWTRAGLHHLALAGMDGPVAEAAVQTARLAGVEEGLHLAAGLRAPGWVTLLPGCRECWSRLDPRTLSTESLAPDLGRSHLQLTHRLDAVIHPAAHDEINRIWLEFRIGSGADPSNWRLGVILRYMSPRDFHVLLLGSRAVQLKRFVAEHGEDHGTWHDLAQVSHEQRPAPGTWYRLAVFAPGRGAPARVYLDDRLLATFENGNSWLRGQVGLLAENEPITFRTVKVGLP